MSRTFEQFVRFTNDAAGLERTLRLLQSLLQILTSYTLPLHLILTNTTLTKPILLALRAHIALVRRFFRLFRFLESFRAAQSLYAAVGPGQTHVWLDVFARTFNGMYLLLEASTTVDALGIEGLALWGPGRDRAVNVEAQRFWLFALVCAAVSGVVRIVGILWGGEAKAKPSGEAKSEGEGKGEDVDESEKKSAADSTSSDVKTREETRTTLHALVRIAVTSSLDILIPGSVVGWIPASPGIVGLAMFVTTVLTGMEVWERCGREVGSR